MRYAPRMTDELPALQGADAAAAIATGTNLPEPMLAYDYYKNMVSLSIGTLGGILTLGGTVFGQRIAPWQMGLSALLVALSGLLALQGKTDIIQVCQGMKLLRNSSRVALRLVPQLYGLGIGVFLGFLTISYFGGR